ncbi:MAG: hypothetical protein IKF90_22735 [Parasporobacterium sp.]|nr:hypothetical protein [Parasporobacterium sp.]
MDRTVLQNTADVCEKDYLIEEGMVDKAGKVTCSTLARFMQDMTTVHMNQAGISVESLMAENLLWVIVCTQINISRLPKAGETVEQYSWAGAEKFGMHSRRFAFFTKEGEELLNAASLFLLVNKETRALCEPTKETLSLPIVEVEGEPKLPKMMQKYPTLMFGKTHIVQDSEIDYNDHVNNAVYLDWADSIFDNDFIKNREIKGFWVQYDKEIVLGQNVEMKYATAENSAFLKGCVEGADCFKVKFDF